MLKSLELFGFKSFADRTRFDFASGITGVVGPNGSGKSNVVDAIKWILGDQSAKSLRGKEMSDVIFNGATGRKAASYAEATLTLDNSNGMLPIESQEVQIGRRLWRGGDAEYLINRNTARLKDVRELFMGTGAGASAYCIIEQGRVDQVLQSNPTNRRAVFEEAAGISRYKARKTEALRKLERVDQNLLRLRDIVDQVDAQLNSVRSQAVKAAKFRETSDELRKLWLGLAADEQRHLTAKIDEASSGLDGYRLKIELLAQEQHELELAISALDEEIGRLDDRVRESDRNASGVREKLASHESTISHQTARNRELEADVLRLRRQCAMLASRVHECVAERERAKLQLDKGEVHSQQRRTELEARAVDIEKLAATVNEQRTRLNGQRRQVAELARRITADEDRIVALDSQIQTARELELTIVARRDEYDEAIVSARTECDRQGMAVQEAETLVAEAETRVADVRQQRSSLSGQQEQFQTKLTQRREQRTAKEARRVVLEELENRHEGVGIGVKEILQRAITSRYSPWKDISGSVADLLEVDLERAALLEVALGDRAQLLVIDSIEPLFDYVKDGNVVISGRVGFLPSDDRESAESARSTASAGHEPGGSLEELDIECELIGENTGGLTPPARREDELDLFGRAGVVERADRLVRTSPSHPNLAHRLLRDTWIVETLDVARQLAADVGGECRFVTLQGELLESDGTFYLGGLRTETAIVSRKSELRRLKNDITRLDREIEKEEEQLAAVSTSITGTDVELEAVQAERQRALDRMFAVRAEFNSRERHLEQLRSEREVAEQQRVRCVTQQEQFATLIDETRRDRAAAELDQTRIQGEIDAAEVSLVENENAMQGLEQLQATARLELAKQEERLDGLRDAYRRLESDWNARKQQHQEAERRLETVSAQRQRVVLHILDAGAQLAELYSEKERLENIVTKLVADRNQVRSRRGKLLEQDATLRKSRRELGDAQHTAEIQIRDFQHELAALAGRIEEEYQISLADAVASGASAYRDYLASRTGSKTAPANDETDTEAVEAAESGEETAVEDAASGIEAGLPSFDEVRGELDARVQRLRRKLKLMGSVNTDSLQDLDELQDRYTRLSGQLSDLEEARTTLDEIVRRINSESEKMFAETFTAIRERFRELFRKLFGGGEGDIILEDPNDILECSIDIVARPPGKELRSISLLSGGEKTLTAVAMLLAMFQSRPSPFCILDEVDAALDEANVDRYVNLLREFQSSTQFIMITHSKRSMTAADVLYGVTMEQAGVSKRMTVRFDDVRENGEIVVGSGKAAKVA